MFLPFSSDRKAEDSSLHKHKIILKDLVPIIPCIHEGKTNHEGWNVRVNDFIFHIQMLEKINIKIIWHLFYNQATGQ